MGFGDGEEFVEAVKLRKIVAGAAVEDAELEKVNVRKAQRGTEGKAAYELFQFPLNWVPHIWECCEAWAALPDARATRTVRMTFG